MQALLELDCIPSGMELFAAADDDQWTLIKKVIDECDYYIVILARRYGSVDSTGKSFTEKESLYALSKNKPIIAFLHKDLGSILQEKSETEPEKREKLNAFRELAKQKMCRFWMTPEELGSVVSRSMVKLMKSNPAIGWIRADDTSDTETSKENIRLQKQIQELESKLQSFGVKGPEGVEELAQGTDEHRISFTTEIYDGPSYYRAITKKSSNYFVSKTWNEIMKIILPRCIPESTENTIKNALQIGIVEPPEELRSLVRDSDWKINDHSIPFVKVKEIIVQLNALGLITPNEKKRSLTDSSNYWTLTPYGKTMLTKVCAIPRIDTHGPE